jgi:curved DNA-binding protein CbpA
MSAVSRTANHYEVLGVPATASTAAVREAYRERARRLHPDRLIDASPRERDQAAAEMAAVNEAWRVLGDTRRRRAYDEVLAGGPPSRNYADTTMGDDLVDVAGPPALIRGLPWIVLVFVLVLIFVFTAYAATGGDGTDDDGPSARAEVGDCVSLDDGAVTPISCRSVNDGQVIAVRADPSECPAGTEPIALTSERRVICVAR